MAVKHFGKGGVFRIVLPDNQETHADAGDAPIYPRVRYSSSCLALLKVWESRLSVYLLHVRATRLLSDDS